MKLTFYMGIWNEYSIFCVIEELLFVFDRLSTEVCVVCVNVSTRSTRFSVDD